MWTGFDIKGGWHYFIAKMGIYVNHWYSGFIRISWFFEEVFQSINHHHLYEHAKPRFQCIAPCPEFFWGRVTTSPGPGNPVLGTAESETFYMDVICDSVLGGLEVGESQDDVNMRAICCRFWCDLKLASVLQRRSHCMSRWEGMVGNVSYSTSLERSFARTFFMSPATDQCFSRSARRLSTVDFCNIFICRLSTADFWVWRPSPTHAVTALCWVKLIRVYLNFPQPSLRFEPSMKGAPVKCHRC